MIVAEHVTKYYGARAAVSDLSFRIGEGEVVGLLGLNGAGKTTTMRVLSGLVVPTSVRVFIAGLDMSENPEGVRSRIGFLPETPPLYPEMTVDDFLTFVAHIKGLRGGVAAAVHDALAATDLLAVRHERIATLSHGFQKRIGIAQAIVHKPALILLDEPTSGLDPVQVVQMRQLIKGLSPRHTVLVSSHILSEIHQMCDRIFVLQQGRIAAQGSEAELASKVAGSITLQIEVRGSAARLAELFARHSGIAGHRIDGEAQGTTSATVELVGDSREDLARAIVEAGLGLRRLERVQLELESIFLKLTGTAKREPALESA